MASPADVARLAAGAKGGSAGVKEYDQAQQAVGSAKNVALKALGQSAGLFSHPVSGAFMRQLGSEIAAPATTAIGNLQRSGAADLGQRNATTSGTNLYEQEANQAIPLINAEANRDLGQRVAMLHASTSSSGGGGLTDTKIKEDLLGAALRARAATAAQKQSAYEQGIAALNNQVAQQGQSAAQQYVAQHQPPPFGAVGFGQPVAPQFDKGGITTSLIGFAGSPESRAQQDAFVQPFNQAAVARLQPQANTQAAALAQALNNLAGPGLTNEAIQIGTQAGLDPNRLAGLLTPNVDQTYVAAQKRLGAYVPPGQQTVANQITPAMQAATELGYTPHEFRQAAKTTYFDWAGDGKLNATFQKWLALPAQTSLAGKTLEEQQRAFEQSPGAERDAKNIVADIVADANHAINNGYDYDTFTRMWEAEQVAKSDPRTVALGLRMVAPLFQYNAAHTRTAVG